MPVTSDRQGIVPGRQKLSPRVSVSYVFMGRERPARKINRGPGNTDEEKPFLWDKMAHATCHELVSFISLLSVKNVASGFCAIFPLSPSL